MMNFYLLSLLSGFFEIAPFVLALRTEGVLAALTLSFCYQLGNLTPCPLTLSRHATKAAALFGGVALAIYAGIGYFPPLCVATILLSSAIQTARSASKANASKPIKRTLRVTGFGLGFFGMPFSLLAAGVLAATLVVTNECGGKKSTLTLPRLNYVNIAMILHQVHYFVYCYAAIALAIEYTSASGALTLFVASWVAYILGAKLYRGRGLSMSFFAGHTLLFCLFLGIFFAPSMSVKAVLWILTGLGGTTEFCLARLAGKHGGGADGGTFAENIGHVLGTVLCIAIYVATQNLAVTVLAAAAAALGAIIVMAAMTLRGSVSHAHTDH